MARPEPRAWPALRAVRPVARRVPRAARRAARLVLRVVPPVARRVPQAVQGVVLRVRPVAPRVEEAVRVAVPWPCAPLALVALRQ